MRTYLYRCRDCDTECVLYEPADDAGPCVECMIAYHQTHDTWPEIPPLMRRVWQVSFAPVMQQHFNTTVGKPISDRRQMDRELRRSSEEATEKTGIPHNFIQVDGSEAKEAAGIDDTLQDEINRVHATGRRLPRTVNTPQAMPEYQSVEDRRKHLERITREHRASSALRSRGKAVAERVGD